MERYKRQIDLIGEDGQAKLSNASVLIVGAGGLGNIASKFLASSGVGYIEIWDDDKVEESNLNRQILFNEESIGKPKVVTLVNTLGKINPDITLHGQYERFESPYDLESIDVVLDCSDNMETTYYLEEQALITGIPLVFGATSKWSGLVTVIREKYLKENYPNKQLNKEHSVIGPIGGIIGSLQAGIAIKLIVGLPVGEEVMHYDLLNNVMTKFNK